jgi:hypothetical protein
MAKRTDFGAKSVRLDKSHCYSRGESESKGENEGGAGVAEMMAGAVEMMAGIARRTPLKISRLRFAPRFWHGLCHTLVKPFKITAL